MNDMAHRNVGSDRNGEKVVESVSKKRNESEDKKKKIGKGVQISSLRKGKDFEKSNSDV